MLDSAASPSVFDLTGALVAKAAPWLIARDEAALAAIGASVADQIDRLERRLAAERRSPAGGENQAGLDRDLAIHRMSARLRLLHRFGLDLCLGRIVLADDPEPRYIGRVGITGADGRPLLLDWRSPAAEPFFAATHAHPQGLVSRRRYRWDGGRIRDYWDEVFTPAGLVDAATLDDQSAFIASLGASRSAQMRDVLTTIAADQDAIIREPAPGALIVDGGPGTGKTVVALHRAAYLLYADPRLGHRRGGVLFVGPHEPYLKYVADVLPSLGEEGVLTGTIRDLLPEGATATVSPDPAVARLLADARMVAAIEPAIRLYEEPPREPTRVRTPWLDLVLTTEDWAFAFAAIEPGTPHNEAHDQIWDALLDRLVARTTAELAWQPDDPGGWDRADPEAPGYWEARAADPHAEDWSGPSDGGGDGDGPGDSEDPELSAEAVRRTLAADPDLRSALQRAWPILDAEDIVADLWSVPAYLRRCAPWLTGEQVAALQRPDATTGWTLGDLPLLDAARRRLGDAQAAGRERRRAAAQAATLELMDGVVEHLVHYDHTEMQVMSMLRVDDLQGVLALADDVADGPVDRYAGPFAHVIVDEAQELTDAEWQMLLARCPSHSLTIVGDRAQARLGFPESWRDRLERVGLRDLRQHTLTINYRTPAEVMEQAAPVIRAVLPDASVPTSVRSTGIPVRVGSVDDLPEILAAWADTHPEGVACVIGHPTYAGSERVRALSPQLAKGLEFDLVVLVEPAGGTGGGPGGGTSGAEGDAAAEADRARTVAAAVDRYVAMTRTTQELVVLVGP